MPEQPCPNDTCSAGAAWCGVTSFFSSNKGRKSEKVSSSSYGLSCCFTEHPQQILTFLEDHGLKIEDPDLTGVEQWWDPMCLKLTITTTATAPPFGKRQEAALQRRTRRTANYWHLRLLNIKGPQRPKPEGWDEDKHGGVRFRCLVELAKRRSGSS